MILYKNTKAFYEMSSNYKTRLYVVTMYLWQIKFDLIAKDTFSYS